MYNISRRYAASAVAVAAAIGFTALSLSTPAYAAARTLHLTTVSACWQLDTGRDAGRDADVAAYWLAEHGPAALRTCHHLHGGLGMDITYPLPRYSALMTDLTAFVGGAADRLDRLGAREAATA